MGIDIMDSTESGPVFQEQRGHADCAPELQTDLYRGSGTAGPLENEGVNPEMDLPNGATSSKDIPDSVPPPWAALETSMADGFAAVMEMFNAKLAYDATKQQQIDLLHKEVVQHRANLAANLVRPYVNGLIGLHDDIGRLVSSLKAKPVEEITPLMVFGLFDGLQDDVEILLGQNGIKAFRDPPGQFNPARQRLLRQVPTGDPSLAGLVADSVRPGFEQDNVIIEKERVSVYVFKPGERDVPSAVPVEDAPVVVDSPEVVPAVPVDAPAEVISTRVEEN